MAPATLSTLLNDYSTLIILTAVGYDYILTFSDEIEYIWKKSWTRVSVLYALARYLGLCSVIIFALLGSSFLPISGKTYVLMLHLGLMNDITERIIVLYSCSILFYVCAWAILIFIGAADLVMILRVWALYNRSKMVFGVLFTLYLAEVIICIVDCIILNNEKAIAVLGSASFCNTQFTTPLWSEITMLIIQMTLSVLLCLLVAVQFITRSLEMYKETKQARLNHYISLLSRDGLFYFFAVTSYSLVGALTYVPNISSSKCWDVLAGPAEYVPVFTLTPRFILGLRELYARDVHVGRSKDVDTAFGLASTPDHGTVPSVIVFVGARRNGDEEPDEVELEGVKSRVYRGSEPVLIDPGHRPIHAGMPLR